MNHPFSPSITDPTKCTTCTREYIDHSDRATCENCGSSGEMNLTSTKRLLCIECDYKEVRVRTPDELTDRANLVRQKFTEIDAQIKIQTDIFNAKTIAIHEIKKSIDEDPSIPENEKYFALAKHIETRFNNLVDIISGRRKEIVEAENEQRAIQTYYNELSKKLRAEERENIRLKDVTYRPIEPKVAKTPKAPKIKKGPNLNEVKEACVQHGIPEAMAMVQMVCVATGIGVEEAIERYKSAKAKVAK